MIDDDVDDVDVTYSQEKSGRVQIRVNTTCRNYGGVQTPRTPMDRRHCPKAADLELLAATHRKYRSTIGQLLQEAA